MQLAVSKLRAFTRQGVPIYGQGCRSSRRKARLSRQRHRCAFVRSEHGVKCTAFFCRQGPSLGPPPIVLVPTLFTEVWRLAGQGPAQALQVADSVCDGSVDDGGAISAEVAPVLDRLLSSLLPLSPDVAAVLFPGPEGRWRLYGIPGMPRGVIGERVIVARSAWDGCGPVRGRSADEPDGVLRRCLEASGVDHLLCIPVTDGSERHAVLLLGRGETPFSAGEVSSALATADLAAAALSCRRARQAVNVRDACLEALLGPLPDPAWICFPDGRVGYASPAAVAFHRRTGRGEVPEGRLLRELLGLTPDSVPAGLRLPMRPDKGEIRCQCPAGEFLLMFVSGAMQVEGGPPLGLVVIGRDVTDEDRRRQESRRQERLAALGQLAAGAAHEIRNPLTAVRGFLQLVSSQIRTEPQAHYLKIVRQEMERIERITADLLLLSRSWKLRLAECELGPLLETVAELVRPRAEERGVDLRVCAEPGLPPVFADSERLEQVFLNLVGNAIEAIRGAGCVELRARRQSGGFIEGVVTDDGPGVPAEVLPRLFEPFFTTKAGGTGLGLAVSDSIVRSFGGHISVASPPGGGATFTVRLPVSVTAGAVTGAGAAPAVCVSSPEG